MRSVDIESLKREVAEAQRKHPDLSQDNAFVLWFMRAYLVEDDRLAAESVVGRKSDKGFDAIYVDHPNKKVFVVQGKYRTTSNPPNECRPDLVAFADLARVLRGEKREIDNLLAAADPAMHKRVTDVHGYLRRRGYELNLYFVTTGKVSPAHQDEMKSRVADTPQTELRIFCRQRLLNLLHDYLDGAAPPVPCLDLPVEPGENMRGGGIIKRYDTSTRIESWVFSMLGSDVGDLFARTGVRLFARNIRGFLGNTDINRAMRRTLESEPQNFWYFNNGITIVCDDVRKIEEHGKESLRVFNPQIINGQQTTHVLKDHRSKQASVLIRVIAIPRDQSRECDGFEGLVGNIVAATNYQNAIKPSDLRSNDEEQVRIERELHRLNYQYLRKRESKAEIRRRSGTPSRFQLKKEDLAKAVAACEFDPVLVREGKERLFKDPHYQRIFCRRSGKEYLSFVLLDRIVKSQARGKPARAYARWLVLNFLWGNVRKLFSQATVRDKFLHVCQHKADERRLRPLMRLGDISFRAALAFHRTERGMGEESLDPSTFFKRSGLHERFQKYWLSRSNRRRRQFRKEMNRFAHEVGSAEVE